MFEGTGCRLWKQDQDPARKLWHRSTKGSGHWSVEPVALEIIQNIVKWDHTRLVFQFWLFKIAETLTPTSKVKNPSCGQPKIYLSGLHGAHAWAYHQFGALSMQLLSLSFQQSDQKPTFSHRDTDHEAFPGSFWHLINKIGFLNTDVQNPNHTTPFHFHSFVLTSEIERLGSRCL